jgi:hypothetical protein
MPTRISPLIVTRLPAVVAQKTKRVDLIENPRKYQGMDGLKFYQRVSTHEVVP